MDPAGDSDLAVIIASDFFGGETDQGINSLMAQKNLFVVLVYRGHKIFNIVPDLKREDDILRRDRQLFQFIFCLVHESYCFEESGKTMGVVDRLPKPGG